MLNIKKLKNEIFSKSSFSRSNDIATNNRAIRDNKGKEYKSYIKDYCVLDLETTDFKLSEAEIIEIGILKVRNNNIVDSYSSLIRPSCSIPKEVSYINNITDDMVQNAPKLNDIIDNILTFIGDDIVVGHNVRRFDINLLYNNVLALRNRYFTNDFIDTLEMAKRSNIPIENFRLSTLSKYYGEETKGEHRSLKDCELNKIVYERLWEDYGENCFYGKHNPSISSDNKSYYPQSQYSENTWAIRDLNSLVSKIVEDEVVTAEEANELNDWVSKHQEISNNYPCNKILKLLNDIFEDNTVTREELEELKTLLNKVLDPVLSSSCTDSIKSVKDKHICLTGDFQFGSKSDVEDILVSQRAIIDKNVKKATNYLIVGGYGSSAWVSKNYGSKVKRAIEYNDKYKGSVNIKIIREDLITHLLNESK